MGSILGLGTGLRLASQRRREVRPLGSAFLHGFLEAAWIGWFGES